MSRAGRPLSEYRASEYLASEHGTRYWLLVHALQKYRLDWDDGERLLALSSAVRTGRLDPQPFTFHPRRGSADSAPVTLLVTPDDPFELLTEYDAAAPEEASHWFG